MSGGPTEGHPAGAVRDAVRQDQFLTVLARDEAVARVRGGARARRAAAPRRARALAAALGRVLAHDLAAPIDVPPFDRANVDGFALRAADTPARAMPRRAARAQRRGDRLRPCAEARRSTPGTATAIATGGVMPRGADAVVMIEQTELIESGPAIELRRAAAPGQFISYAGSDIARGETLLRRGAQIASREIGMLAACGLAEDRRGAAADGRGALDRRRTRGARRAAAGRPRSTTPTARSSRPRCAKRAASRSRSARFRTTKPRSKQRCARRSTPATCVVLSGGTSKGAGDLSHRVVSRLGAPGILVHGVALKPGKPLCLAVARRQAARGLPGFPTSAIFTFHAFVAPVIRARAGLPRGGGAHRGRDRAGAHRLRDRAQGVRAGRAGRGRGGPVALPAGKGSGSVTSLLAGRRISRDRRARAARSMPARRANVTLIGSAARAPDLVIIGSHASRSTRCSARWPSTASGAHHRDRQHGRRCGGAARRMRSRADPSDRSGDRHLQRAFR